MTNKAKLIVIFVMVLIIVVTTTETKNGLRKETVEVVECVAVDDCYEVTVEDSKGNLWSYYDSEGQRNGNLVRVTWNGDEIVDVTTVRK